MLGELFLYNLTGDFFGIIFFGPVLFAIALLAPLMGVYYILKRFIPDKGILSILLVLYVVLFIVISISISK
ncbi:MAG: hypothetical protein WCK10_00885 [Candidatus Staskawiczbacteria bacterium]